MRPGHPPSFCCLPLRFNDRLAEMSWRGRNPRRWWSRLGFYLYRFSVCDDVCGGDGCAMILLALIRVSVSANANRHALSDGYGSIWFSWKTQSREIPASQVDWLEGKPHQLRTFLWGNSQWYLQIRVECGWWRRWWRVRRRRWCPWLWKTCFFWRWPCEGV